MSKTPKYDPQDFDELSRQIDVLLGTSGARIVTEDDGIDLAQFTPATASIEDGAVYQNFSNGYGAARSTGGQGIPAYNRDLHKERPTSGEYRDYGGQRMKSPRKAANPSKKSRRGCCGCGCATVLLLLAAAVAGVMIFLGSLFEMPVTETALGARKEKTSTILLCGTDKDGTRTDTMMLVYLDGAENRVGLLSLPRATLTITSEGKRAKLNSAYGRNGGGENGMDWTMTYVERTIGYRPDGYILVDMELGPKRVHLMGGVDVHLDHHIRVHTDGVEVYVPAGDAHLNGEEVLATLRYRAGYANADLGRVQVQRMVSTECMKQWVSPAKLAVLPDALELIQDESLTDLSVNNFLWIGKTILTGMDNMTSDTLPGYADMRGGASYFILYPEQVAELVSGSYNPYQTAIDADDLEIAE